MHYVTLYFLKVKHEANQYIKEYLTHLQVCSMATHTVRVDHGTEFVNKDLQDWCHVKGMDIQFTAPYSPLQNGVAEQMNCMLVELARTMLLASKLPEFLWELAVAHAAYVCNRAYTTSIKGSTPYQAWHRWKPNVAHLHKFGAPVWILLQGQN
jgi:transposase InsO family protein